MFCDQCGNKLSDGAIFCESCGSRQSANKEAPKNTEAPKGDSGDIFSLFGFLILIAGLFIGIVVGTSSYSGFDILSAASVWLGSIVLFLIFMWMHRVLINQNTIIDLLNKRK